MNFVEKMVSLMTQNGMFKQQAEEIMNGVVNDPTFASGTMGDRWTDKVEDYPEPMVNSIWACIKPEALKWIDKNLPLAWYRPMFLPTDDLKQLLHENGRDDLAKTL